MNIKRFFLSGLIGCTCFLSADAEDKTNFVELKSNADVKEFLKLPYDVNFSNARQEMLGDFKTILDGAIGLGNFAIISVTEKSKPYGLSFEVCSADLTLYNVSVTMPESCQAACDMIFFSKVLTSSSNKGVAKYMVPKRDAQTYSLLHTGRPDKYHLCLEKGFLVYVAADRFSQPLRAPVNIDVLIAQVNALMDNVIALFDGKNVMTDKQQEYYHRLKIEYAAAHEVNKELPILITTPVSATRFDMILLDLSNKKSTHRSGNSVEQTKQKVIPNNAYLLARIDGRALPVVKIADPKMVTTKIEAQKYERIEADGICDIQFQVTYQETPYSFDANLRSDGRYQFKFRNPKETMLEKTLRVLYLNKGGEIIEYGEVELNVVANSNHSAK